MAFQFIIMAGLAGVVLVAVLGGAWWLIKDKPVEVVDAPRSVVPPATSLPPQPAPSPFEQPSSPPSNAEQQALDSRLENQVNTLQSQSRAFEAEVNQLQAEKRDHMQRMEALERALNQERTRADSERAAAHTARQAELQAKQAAAEAERIAREATALVAEPIAANATPLSPAAIKLPAKARVPELDNFGNRVSPDRVASSDVALVEGPSYAIAEDADDAATGSVSSGPDAEHRQLLLTDIDHALTLISEDKIEQLISDFFPIEAVRAARTQGVTDKAEELRRTKSSLDRLERGLRECRTATFQGNNDKVVCMTGPAASTDSPDAATAVISIPKEISGYGSDLKAAIQSAIEDLRGKDYLPFLEKMLPISEVLRLKQSQMLELTAQRFVDQPEMAELLLADLEAIAKLDLNAEGDLVRLALSGRNSGETKREVRFQQVAGSWRFFDQSTEIRARQDALQRIGDQQTSSSGTLDPILKFERIREHWRLRELP